MMDSYHELIDALSGTPRRLQAVSSETAGKAPRSNEDWGVTEIVCHLTDYEKVYRGRIMTVLTQNSPYLRSVDFEEMARQHDYASRSLEEAVDEFGRERGETISVLLNLALKDWERTGIHDKFGEISIEELIERLVDHDAEYLERIEAGQTAA
jgi:hypothetical protein